jgi:hypothetical protein
MKVPESCPAVIVNWEGTVRYGLLDSRGRLPAEGRACVSVTLQVVVVEAGAIIAAGTQTTDDISTLTMKAYVS